MTAIIRHVFALLLTGAAILITWVLIELYVVPHAPMLLELKNVVVSTYFFFGATSAEMNTLAHAGMLLFMTVMLYGAAIDVMSSGEIKKIKRQHKKEREELREERDSLQESLDDIELDDKRNQMLLELPNLLAETAEQLKVTAGDTIPAKAREIETVIDVLRKKAEQSTVDDNQAVNRVNSAVQRLLSTLDEISKQAQADAKGSVSKAQQELDRTAGNLSRLGEQLVQTVSDTLKAVNGDTAARVSIQGAAQATAEAAIPGDERLLEIGVIIGKLVNGKENDEYSDEEVGLITALDQLLSIYKGGRVPSASCAAALWAIGTALSDHKGDAQEEGEGLVAQAEHILPALSKA